MVSVLFSVTAASMAKVPIWLLLSANPGSAADEVDEVNTNEAVCVSIRSRSWNVIVSDATRLPEATLSSVTPPVATVEAPTMVGASLVPVMVMVTSWVTVPPWSSSSVTV